MAERLNTHMNVVILPDGSPGYVRNMNIKFKARHGEAGMTKEQIREKRLREKEREESGKERWKTQGQMVEHVRKQKRTFMGREERKHIRGHGFSMRLARARELMFKESIPKLKPSVIIKAKGDRPSYVRDDPRLKEALRAFKHTIRAQRPLDEKINRDFGPYPPKSDQEIPLIQIHSEASDEEIDQDPTPKIPTKVSISNFLMRPQLMGNLSDDEDKFEENGSPILVKLEAKSDDSEEEDTPENDEAQTLTKKTQATPMAQTRTEIASPDAGSTDSSSEEDDEPPTDKAIEEAQKKVAFEFFREFMENHKTGTALVQALKKTKFSFPVSRGVTKRCGEDFFAAEIPKEAKIRKLKQKGKGVGKKSSRHSDSGTTSHNSAQEREPSATRVIAQEHEVLEIGITKDETENLYAENNSKSKAGTSGQRKERSGEKERRKDKGRTTKSEEKPERKRQSSPKQERIKFF